MKRSPRLFAGLALLAAGLIAATPASAAAKRPNVLWVLSEDNSTHYLRLYGNPLGPMPAVEKLAAHGLVFEHAFSCAPVCSVARTTLMTGCYAPRVGSQYHRRAEPANLPKGVEMWPAYLRQAGYYTSNNSKKDYNVVEGRVWDESSNKASWRKRPSPETPFFHMHTFTTSHESSLHFSREQMAREQLTTPTNQVHLPPYFPDTPTFRHTYARYCDRIRAVDGQIGSLVADLERDGLLEDTFIFYFGDHGGVLPRGKGYVYESGLHVPLVVRIPEKWKHLADFKPGTRVNGFVQFIDFGPTVLQLAGVPVPKELDGRPFLGAGVAAREVNARDEAFGYADRFDEKYDLVRTLRKGQWKYVRNYQAHLPDGLQNNYRYRMLAYQEWRDLFRAGRLDEVQSRFFQRRPAEQLFYLETDPHEVNNLADDPMHAEVLRDMRERLRARVKGINDLSFYPESHMVEHALEDGAAYGRAHAAEIARLVDIADLSLDPFAKVEARLRTALNSKIEWERYWALIACSVLGQPAKSLAGEAEKRLKDDNLLVRTRAAEFLALVAGRDPRPTLYEVLNQTRSGVEALLIFNSAVLFHDGAPAYPFDLSKVKLQVKMGEVTRRTDYLGGKLE